MHLASVLLPSEKPLTLPPPGSCFDCPALVAYFGITLMAVHSLTLGTHSHDSRDSTEASTGQNTSLAPRVSAEWMPLGPALPEAGLNPLSTPVPFSHQLATAFIHL